MLASREVHVSLPEVACIFAVFGKSSSRLSFGRLLEQPARALSTVDPGQMQGLTRSGRGCPVWGSTCAAIALEQRSN